MGIDLPPELRQMIYRYLFTNLVFIQKRTQTFNPRRLPCAVLLVSKSFYMEASAMFHHASTFRLLVPAPAPRIYSLEDLRRLHRAAIEQDQGVVAATIQDTMAGASPLAQFTQFVGPCYALSLTSIKFNVQRHPLANGLWIRGRALNVAPSCFRPIVDKFPNLREIRISCRRLYHDHEQSEQPYSHDYTRLKGVSIVVEPESIDQRAIQRFDCDSFTVRFVVAGDAIVMGPEEVRTQSIVVVAIYQC